MMEINARSTLTNALSKQSDRVEKNAQKIAEVGTKPAPKEAPKTEAPTDSVEISADAQSVQAASDQNLASVIVDNKQAENAYKAAASALKVVDEMDGAVLDLVADRKT